MNQYQNWRHQLQEWKKDVEALKHKAKDASADTKEDMNKWIDHLELKLKEFEVRLDDRSEKMAETLEEGLEETWLSLKYTVHEVMGKFKK